MSKQHDVFLSYSRKDQKVMEQVRDALRAQDIIVWTDEYLEAGTPVWERSIEQAIRDSRSLLVLLSPDASESIWVRSELRMASDKKLTIFPVLVRGEESSDIVPLGVYSSQWIDVRSKLDLVKIAESVQNKLGIKSRSQLEAEILNLQAQLKVEREKFERDCLQTKTVITPPLNPIPNDSENEIGRIKLFIGVISLTLVVLSPLVLYAVLK